MFIKRSILGKLSEVDITLLQMSKPRLGKFVSIISGSPQITQVVIVKARFWT